MRYGICIAALWLIGVQAGSAGAATPLGFSSASITLNAVVEAACQEVQQGSFPSPLVIDAQSASEQNFSATTDEKITCTNGTVFTLRVTSTNGTAVNQTCTSGGVSSMALRSAGSPADSIAYTFICGGDTDGLGHFTGEGFNVPKAVGMSIKIAAADAQAAVVHADYTDTVTMTISY
jgi:hypothetical protein